MAPYALTIFASAFLLFLVQPLMGRFILPWFGGTPAVWTSCMLFFQVLLLAGYAYSHATADWLRPRAQAGVHLFLLLGSLAMLAVLPIVPAEAWKPTGDESPPWRIMALLAVTIGTPYFVLSTTGPLLQHWFGHVHPGRSPYRLYALSNVGSLLALVSYPFVVEPALTLRVQARGWTWAYAAFVLACGWCAARFFRPKPETGENPDDHKQQTAAVHQDAVPGPSSDPSLGARGATKPGERTGDVKSKDLKSKDLKSKDLKSKKLGLAPQPTRAAAGNDPSQRPSWLDMTMWLLLATCGSVMLLATTNQMCQEVPPVPFLWILPLALYLLSFVICFDSPRWYLRWLFGPLLAVSAVAACILLYVGVGADPNQPWVKNVLEKLAGWHIHVKMSSLEKLVDDLANVQVQIAIYAIVLFACVMACHGELTRSKPHHRHLTLFYLLVAAGGALGGVLVALVAPRVFSGFWEYHIGLAASCGLMMIAVARDRTGWLSFDKRWWAWIPLVTLLAVLIFALDIQRDYGLEPTGTKILEQTRNFFGVLRVTKKEDDANGPKLSLTHGRILHGYQYQDADKRGWPTTYYGFESGVGLAVGYHPHNTARPALQKPLRIGVVGLGTGTIAAYGRRGDYLRFYEINPEVVRLSGPTGQYFTYFQDSPAKKDIVLGDARVQMERELARGEPQKFDVLAVDAFSSDSIPMHLITLECFKVYKQHLAEGGILAMHVSNRYMNLEIVVRGAAKEIGMDALRIRSGDNDSQGASAATWVLVTDNRAFINSPAIVGAVSPWTKNDPEPRVWTDDFASLTTVLNKSEADVEEPASEDEGAEPEE
jgi:hypothetical protein